MAVRRTRPRSANARHHAEWLRLIEVSGPFLSLPVLERVFPHGLDAHEPERSAELRRLYEDWQDTKGDPAYHGAWVESVLRHILELPDELILRPQTFGSRFDVRVAQHHETLRPDLVLVNPAGRDGAGETRLLVQIVPADQDVDKPLRDVQWKASPATRMTELVRGIDGVRVGLVTNGEQWMLVHAPRRETACYVTWIAALWLDEPITLRAFRSLLDVRRFFGTRDDETLESLFVASAKDQYDVTDQLGFQVRRAVEILVRAIDRIDRERQRRLLAGFGEKELYEGAVTTMMRLVFLFYAEEHKLLPVDDAVYGANYAVSTLLEQLQDDEEKLGPDVLERRHAAWNRLLATFRAVHGGVEHEAMRLPAHGGGLFDPDRFPFLEGRTRGSRWRDTPAEPLPIDDSTVLDALESLQFLEVRGLSGDGMEAQRLSFKALGVEQIGNVYESLLDHTAVRAERPVLGLTGPEEPEVALDELETRRARGQEEVVRFLAAETGRSATSVAGAFRYEIERDDTRWIVSCGNDPELLNRVRPWAGLVREDSRGIPVVIEPGSVYLTTSSDRRITGTHYTPPSLTEPIVRYTLEPLVYGGPAEGKPEEEWVLRSAREILALKICDMACGSGAFLVQACRYLSERLVDAWARAEAENSGKVVVTPEGELSEARPSECVIPKDPDERLTVARRLVADRCLYGVDVNPMAVEMAKLSLWLVTLEKGKPFTFLDHAIKCGDSLLGVSDIRQIEDFTLDTGSRPRFLFLADACRAALQEAAEARARLEGFTVIDIRDAATKARLLQEADGAVSAVRVIGDTVIGLALVETPDRRREERASREEIERLIQQAFDDHATADRRRAQLGRLDTIVNGLLRGRRPFHWPLEFPEVLGTTSEADRGFHAIVGNPPFLGGQKITGAMGTDYRHFLVKHIARDRRGSADLCAYFFLRAGRLLREGGSLGLLATNTIAQGDTREVGLEQLVNEGFVISRAVPSRQWPGTANLEVAHVWVRRGAWNGTYVLDDRPVSGITPFLTPPGRVSGKPYRLAANRDKSFQGSIVLGMGFILSPDEAQALIARNPRNRDVLFPYLNGEDLNSRPDQSPSRWVINFRDWPLRRGTPGRWLDADPDQQRKWLSDGVVPDDYPEHVAADYPDCLRIVEEKVKPERERNKRKVRRERWWQFGERAPDLYATIAGMERVLVLSIVTHHVGFAIVPANQVFAHRLVVFPIDDWASFGVLQSNCHEVWARAYSSQLETRLNYSPSDCFETFPLPVASVDLGVIGERCYGHRKAVMLGLNEGLTRIYNRFHDPKQASADVLRLRELQVRLDAAVVKAYGWTDLDLDHRFHATKQGVRFTISEKARDAILERLLALNHERYKEEIRRGLHDGKARRAGTRDGDDAPDD
jgi:hypothetical protein